MTLWRRTRNEVAGAWRSVRYDLGRPEPAEENVTSAGLSTFGGTGTFGATGTLGGTGTFPSTRPFKPAHARPAPVRRPRRVVAVTAFGALAVAGATGSYLVVADGAGALGGDGVAGEPYPLAAAAPGRDLSNEGFGRGAAILPGVVDVPTPPTAGSTIQVITPTTAVTTDPTPTGPTPAGTRATVTTTPVPARTTVVATTPATPEPKPCDCSSPPAPTPATATPDPGIPVPTPAPVDPPVPTPATESPSTEPSTAASTEAPTKPSWGAKKH
ncbi:hypothetical protein [Actinoplanes sp. NPDC051494]|uniref:hypothetical protein n=1 Tax=Actinoplanes sp. NPDC051494 TaxID=3363907 RepID=UPI00378C6D25